MNSTEQPNPVRKFHLLKTLTQVLGPDLTRRTLSVKALEEIAEREGVDISNVPTR